MREAKGLTLAGCSFTVVTEDRLEVGQPASIGFVVPHQIIRRIRTAHCKKGPGRCPQCRELSDGAICLLELWPPDAGTAQRRMISLNEGGQRTWYAYEVVRKFDTAAEARAFAEQNAVDDVEL